MHVMANINRGGGLKQDKSNLKQKSNAAHLFLNDVLNEESPEHPGSYEIYMCFRGWLVGNKLVPSLRLFKGLIRPLRALYKALKGVIIMPLRPSRVFKALGGLIRPLRAL